MTITTRAGKGSALTHAELDANFTTIGATHGANYPTLVSNQVRVTAPREYFFSGEVIVSFYPVNGYQARKYSSATSTTTYTSDYGSLTGSPIMPDGLTTITGVLGVSNPGQVGLYICGAGNSGVNQGWSSVAWESTNYSGSANASAFQFSTHTNRVGTTKSWLINQYKTFTGDNPFYITNDGWFKLTFTP